MNVSVSVSVSASRPKSKVSVSSRSRRKFRKVHHVCCHVCIFCRLGHFRTPIVSFTDRIPNQCTPDTLGTCHPNAICTQVTPYVCACNPASSYRCQCNPGYTGDGLNCTGEPSVIKAIYCRLQLLAVFGGTLNLALSTINRATSATSFCHCNRAPMTGRLLLYPIPCLRQDEVSARTKAGCVACSNFEKSCSRLPNVQ